MGIPADSPRFCPSAPTEQRPRTPFLLCRVSGTAAPSAAACSANNTANACASSLLGRVSAAAPPSFTPRPLSRPHSSGRRPPNRRHAAGCSRAGFGGMGWVDWNEIRSAGRGSFEWEEWGVETNRRGEARRNRTEAQRVSTTTPRPGDTWRTHRYIGGFHLKSARPPDGDRTAREPDCSVRQGSTRPLFRFWE